MNIGNKKFAKVAASGFLAVSLLLAGAPLAMAKTSGGAKTVAKAKTTSVAKKVAKAKKKTKTTSTSHKVTKKTVPVGSGSATIDATQDATQSVTVADASIAPAHTAKVAKVKKTSKAKKPKAAKVPSATASADPSAVSPYVTGLPRGSSSDGSGSVTGVQPADTSSDWSTDAGANLAPQPAGDVQPTVALPTPQAITATATVPPANVKATLGLGSVLGSSFMGILVSVKRILSSL